MEPSDPETPRGENEADSPGNPDEMPISGWVAFWPSEQCPDSESIERALSKHLDAPIEVRGAENSDEEREQVPWVFAAELPGLGVEVVVWAQRAVKDAFASDPELHALLDPCPWVVRMQAALGHRDPVADHFALTGLLAAIVPEAPAILDASSDLIFDRAQLETHFLASTAQPLERRLWSIQGVPAAGEGAATVTLATKGLARCHRPELEIAELPLEHLEAALALLQGAASIVLEQEAAPTSEPIEVGHELRVRLAPVDATDPAEPRARICDPSGNGAATDGRAWPSEAIARIESGHAALVVTARAAQELRATARRTFADFATAWGALRRSDDPALRALSERSFFVLAPVDPGGTEPVSEHAWFRVTGVEDAMLRAELLEAPLQRTDLAAGAVMLLSTDLVRGWRVELHEKTFGPDQSAALLAEIDRLRGMA